MPTNPQTQLTNSWDAEIAEYHPLSRLAVVGLILGLLTPLAMVDPVVWLLPPLGVLISGLALWRIAQNAPEMAGRKAALIGLMLSILFGTAAPTQWLGYRWLLRREARQFADAWFEFLRQGEPHKAYQLALHPEYRQPLDDKLWRFYRESPHWRGELKNYVSQQPVRTLLALGQTAQVRYYDVDAFQHKHGHEVVWLLYAVTYDDGGEKKTFFVNPELERLKLPTGRSNWRVAHVGGNLLPEGW